MIKKYDFLEKGLSFLICLGIVSLSLILSSLNDLSERTKSVGLMSHIVEIMPRLGKPGYEHFNLDEKEVKILNKTINSSLKKPYYSFKDIGQIYALLYVKHDIMPHDYLSESQRQIFIQKISQFVPENFNIKGQQIRLLKYGLGINNVGELKNARNICQKNTLFLDDFDWETLARIDYFFEIINFCKMEYREDINFKRINELLMTSSSLSFSGHFKEHGLNNVPVYVNDCSPAKNGNEAYHCLYFKN
jgi:hypothetical protein